VLNKNGDVFATLPQRKLGVGSSWGSRGEEEGVDRKKKNKKNKKPSEEQKKKNILTASAWNLQGPKLPGDKRQQK